MKRKKRPAERNERTPGYLDRILAMRCAGQCEEAEAEARSLLARDPANPRLLNVVGALAFERARIEEARSLFEKAVRLDPRDPEILNNLGVAYIAARRWKDAAACFECAFRLLPDDLSLRTNLATAWAAEGSSRIHARDVAGAIRAYQASLRANPDFAEAHSNLGTACLRLGRLRSAFAAFRSATRLVPELHAAHSNYLYALNLSPWHAPETIFAAHRDWGRIFPQVERRRPRDPSPERRLRIGYVAADLREHPTVYFLEPLLAAHDRAKFEIFCYANLARPDRHTERIRALTDGWRRIFEMPDEDAAAQIRQDGIDILVDRTGHFGDNRLPLFARRLAPVQASLPGYPNTTGLPAIDYRITDSIADPPGDTERFHTEMLVRLLGPFVCYRAPGEAPDVAPPPVSRSGRITLGAFCARAKVTRPVAELWARILRKLPGSTLLFHHFYGDPPEGAPEYRNPIARLFREYGVGAGRLEFASGMPVAEHLRTFGRVDIVLDPFPYSGNTITCESLWMGVPVVTLEGRTHVSRVSTSLLHAVGLQDWIARSPEEYADLAVARARNPEELARLRACLRQSMAGCALTDAAAYARDIERAYRWMWRQACG